MLNTETTNLLNCIHSSSTINPAVRRKTKTF